MGNVDIIMNTLQLTPLDEIIVRFDAELSHAERKNSSMSRSRQLFGAQEKMHKYVLVRIDTENLAIPIDGLAEIGPMPAITRLPNLPTWIHGITNQRGEIISVIDLGLLFEQQPASRNLRPKIAILYNGKMKVGIGIDQVVATISRPDSDRVSGSDSPLAKAEPEVFRQSLRVDTASHLILQPERFLAMDRLMRFYLA